MYTPSAGKPPTPARKIATYADLRAAPEGDRVELIDGVLYTMPAAAVKHALTSSEILKEAGYKFGKRDGGWLILGPVELHLGRPDPRTLVLIPDVVGWRRERLEELPETQGMELVPDWVCEVLSPGNERYDRGLKLKKYAAAGVAWVWLPNPREYTVEVYKLDGETYRLWALVEPCETAVIPPFDGVELDLREWWIRKGPLVVAEAGEERWQIG